MPNLQNEIRSNNGRDANLARVDMKFELVVIPVSNVDRAKEFYGGSGGGSTPTSPAVTTSV